MKCFLFLHENTCCWYSLEVPHQGPFIEYSQHMFFGEIFFFFFFFYLGFTALSRIFHLYRANCSSKVGKNQRTRGKTTWLSISRMTFPHVTRARLEPQLWETWWIKSQLPYPLSYGGPHGEIRKVFSWYHLLFIFGPLWGWGSGPSCSKLTMSLVNIVKIYIQWYANMLKFFAEKMWVAFALQKLLTFFQQKISEYCILNPLKQLTKWPLTSSLS